MPYIRPIERKPLDPHIDELMTHVEHVGQLNYIITRLCHNWIIKFGKRYVNLNAVIGVLGCVTQELYRVVAAPYEDKKIADNGVISKLDGEN